MNQRPHLVPVVAATLILVKAAYTVNPMGFYTLLRWVVFLCALVIVWCGYQYGNNKSSQLDTGFWWLAVAWVFGAVAILFNPIAPVYLSRESWQVTDAWTAILFLTTLGLRAGPSSNSDKDETDSIGLVQDLAGATPQHSFSAEEDDAFSTEEDDAFSTEEEEIDVFSTEKDEVDVFGYESEAEVDVPGFESEDTFLDSVRDRIRASFDRAVSREDIEAWALDESGTVYSLTDECGWVHHLTMQNAIDASGMIDTTTSYQWLDSFPDEQAASFGEIQQRHYELDQLDKRNGRVIPADVGPGTRAHIFGTDDEIRTGLADAQAAGQILAWTSNIDAYIVVDLDGRTRELTLQEARDSRYSTPRGCQSTGHNPTV